MTSEPAVDTLLEGGARMVGAGADVERAEEIRRRRRAVGIESQWVCSLLGVSTETYSRWENARKPIPPERLRQIGRILTEYERARERIERAFARAA